MYDGGAAGGFILLAVTLFLYFIPTFVGRGRKNAGAIFVLNLLLGWTLIGWVAALCWAMASEGASQHQADVLYITLRESDFGHFPAWKKLRDGQAILLRPSGDVWTMHSEDGALGTVEGEAAGKLSFRADAIGTPQARVRGPYAGHEGRPEMTLEVRFLPGAAGQARLTQTTGAAHSTG